MRNIKINRSFLFVFLVSLLPLFNLITPGLPITHDGLDHVVRIANFYQSLTEGILIPRWAGNLNWGYGHPILMFLYPLPSYITSLFHFFGFSYIDSLKLIFASTYLFSGIFMYLWLKEFLGDRAAIVGSILYLFAPYRFVDLYVRGALGEHVAFTFIPLVLYSLYKFNKLSNKNSFRNYYLKGLIVSISFAALILSHNAISLLFIPFVLFYLFYLFIENKSKIKLVLSATFLVFGLLFSFFFWFPAFTEGKYTLRDIVTAGEYVKRFVEPLTLLYGQWNFGGSGLFSVQVGIVHITLVILSMVLFSKLFKKTDKQKYLYLGVVSFLTVSILLMFKEFNFIWVKITTLQKLQFPWRLLSMVVFSTSLIGSLFISKVNLKYRHVLVIVTVLLSIIFTLNYWHAKQYTKIDDRYFNVIFNGTTDTGESAPIWSIRFMEKKPKDTIEVIEGKASIIKLDRKSTYHEYLIDAKEKTRIRENTLYFPGWKVYDNYNLVNNVQFQDPKNRGLITFYLEPGMHNIIVKFEDTKLRKTANLISITSIILVFIILFIFLINPRTKIKKLK